MSRVNKLFEPFKIGEIELKNRIKLTPLGMGYCTNMRVTDRMKNFYNERAKGGVGLIGISCTPVRLEEDAALPGAYNDKFIPDLKELAELCHDQGAKVYCQLVAPYGWAFGSGPVEWISPSGITLHGRTRPSFRVGLTPAGPQPRALTVTEIHQMVDSIGEASQRARQAGFDAVEIIASSGYTLSQFLSPLTNQRTDEYGGSLENRMRIFLDIVDSVQKHAGSDYPIMFLLSPQHTEGGYTMEELKAFASALERAGVQSFCTRPGWHDDMVEMLQMTVPQGAWVFIAEELKKVVDVPVSAGARITDPFVAEQVIAEGRADLVYMGRALIADPEWPNKAREGRFDEIRPCIGCMRCYDQVGTAVACTVNARVGREGEYIIEPALKPKRVFIIGGGPAGMEAASVAAQRGHQVTLCDKKDRLGGQLLMAAVPPHKEELNKLTEYLGSQVMKNRVDLKLGCDVDVESIEESQPDVVIVATGAVPVTPDIPGVERSSVVTAFDVLAGYKDVGEKVVVLGGGMVGCETAELLAEKGRDVTIVAMRKRIGDDIGPATRRGTLMRLARNGVRIETEVRVEEITDKGVRGTRNGAPEIFEGDSIVLAKGASSDKELAMELEGRVTEMHLIGDCVEPQRIMEAIRDGFHVAQGI